MHAAAMADFFANTYGTRRPASWRSRRLGRLTDFAFDLPLQTRAVEGAIAARIAATPARRVLLAAVEVPQRRADLHAVMRRLSDTRHHLAYSVVPVGARGKFENINAALSGWNLAEFDWVLVVDDDIDFAPGFLDRFLALAEAGNLAICQPAHRFRSHATFTLTYRHFRALFRTTNFVESGPLTAFRAPVLAELLPFPCLRWSWGVDVLWSEIARTCGHRMGIIDAAPIRHLRPVGRSYGFSAAMAEGGEFLAAIGLRRDKRDILRNVEICYGL